MHRFVPGLAGLLVALFPLLAFAQRSAEWQQSVAYEMDIRVHADRHQLSGQQRLAYTNNSPDVLTKAYYHLYFNAFQPNSMMAERNRELPDPDSRVVPRIFELGPDEIGYHRVLTLTQDGVPVDYEVTDTVLRVDLAEPIAPGETSIFEMTFESQVPLQTRRSGRDSRGGGIDFSMAQWYPKMAAYDERGWHADPYIGREFYAPFGTFDVELTLPAEYVVGASGVLQNPDEIGHGYGDAPATNGRSGRDSLTWHFVAENVHDFAWGADPEYVHETFDVDGIAIHLLYKPDVAPSWEPLRQRFPFIVRYFNEHFGRYPWPQFTIIQGGDGGMEYPMLTLISGYTAGFSRPRSAGSVLGTAIHEFAHMWYYGFLGNNEADYSWLDEGFVTYTSQEASAALYNRPANHTGSTLGVLSLQHAGIYERPNTPADWFELNRAFSIGSYSAGAMIVNMLGYVMGEPVRDAWLLEYYDRYKFRHPNPYDVEKTAEDISGLELDWYFEQFGNTTRTLDYEVDDLESRREGDGWRTTLELERETEAVMPVDVLLTLEDGSYQWVNIPLGIMQGHKPVPEDWIVAEPWLWTSSEYTLTVDLPQRVVKAEIDPMLYTPDVNRLNNVTELPLRAHFLEAPRQSWTTYEMGYRPLAQYAHDYGFGVGAQLRGTYLFGENQLKATLKLWPERIADGGDVPGVLEGIDWSLAYTDFVPAFGKLATVNVSTEKHLGFLENTVTLTKPLGRWAAVRSDVSKTLSLSLRHQYTDDDASRLLPFTPDVGRWDYYSHVLMGRLGFDVRAGRDRIAVAAEVGSGVSRHESAARVIVDATKTADLGFATFVARTRLGSGVNQLAWHKQFRFGAATYEDAWRNEAYRTIAAAFEDPFGDAHFVAFDGAGPIAYTLEGHGVLDRAIGVDQFVRMAAGSLELESQPVRETGLLSPLRVSVFSGIGSGEGYYDGWLADAGFGVSYDASELRALRQWTAQSDVLSDLHLVARFPVWVSDPDLIGANEDPLAFRWRLGIQLNR